MMYDRCNARDVWNGRGLLRRRRHLRNSRRSLLEGDQRSAETDSLAPSCDELETSEKSSAARSACTTNDAR